MTWPDADQEPMPRRGDLRARLLRRSANRARALQPSRDVTRCRARLTPSPTTSLLVVLVLALVVASCGGEDDGSSAANSSAAKSSAAKDAGATTTKTQRTNEDGIPTGKAGEVVDVTVGTPSPGEGDPAHPPNQADPNARPMPTDGSGITITSPRPFETVAKAMKVGATVPYGVATAYWSLTRGDGKSVARGVLHGAASCNSGNASGTSCPATIDMVTPANLAKVPIGSYELHVTTFDKAGRQLDDTLIPITVQEKLDPNDVPVDAPPPG